MGKQVVIVLVDVAEGQGVEVLTEQFDLLVADAVGLARVGQFGRQVGRETEAVVDFAEQEGPGVVGDSGIGLPEFDGPVKRGLEEPSVASTHEVHLPFCSCGSGYPIVYRTERGCARQEVINSVNDGGLLRGGPSALRRDQRGGTLNRACSERVGMWPLACAAERNVRESPGQNQASPQGTAADRTGQALDIELIVTPREMP